jgi:hypothetical protein
MSGASQKFGHMRRQFFDNCLLVLGRSIVHNHTERDQPLIIPNQRQGILTNKGNDFPPLNLDHFFHHMGKDEPEHTAVAGLFLFDIGQAEVLEGLLGQFEDGFF